jgi:hypothetical protein
MNLVDKTANKWTNNTNDIQQRKYSKVQKTLVGTPAFTDRLDWHPALRYGISPN